MQAVSVLTHHVLCKIFFLISVLTVYAEAQIFSDDFVPSIDSLSQQDRDLFYSFPYEDFIPLRDSYDFIVVGAGPGGCALVNRLTEVPEWNVLLLEAGRDEDVTMDVPYMASFNSLRDINWNFEVNISGKCAGFDHCYTARGKVIGGTSVLNGMVYSRGNKYDYDNWEAMGNTGWGYKYVQPYFLKSEDMQMPELIEDSTYHSTGGPLPVSFAPYRTPLCDAFVQAGAEIGENAFVDYNGESQTGYSYFQSTLRNGSRCSAARAFLDPVRTRSNLHIRRKSYVTKVIIDENSIATGVEFIYNKKIYSANVSKEVILSAGAINSPQILMLSGVGPREHLEKLGIPLVKELKVGYNLMNQIGYSGLMFLVNDSVGLRTDDILLHPQNVMDYVAYRKGKLTSANDALAFYNLPLLEGETKYPKLELIFMSRSPVAMFAENIRMSDEIYDSVYRPVKDANGWSIVPINLHPKTRGRISLKSADPTEPPLIEYNPFLYDEDIDIVVAGIKIAVRLSKTGAFQKYGSKLHDIPLPECKELEFASDEYWKCAVKQMIVLASHECGTCKMGPDTDKDAVVDPYLNVYGVKGLRVVDASVLPEIISGHTMTPVYMIAEKAADMIKEKYGAEVNSYIFIRY